MSINWIEPGAARKLKESTGIEDTSLFVQYRIEKIDDFGDKESFDLSCSRIEFGLTFDY